MAQTNKNRGLGAGGGPVKANEQIELITNSNTDVGQDGNYRLKMINDELHTQKLIAGTWTPLESI